MLQTNTGSSPSLMLLPPLQPCPLLCSFFHHPHLHLSASTFLSFKLQLRCDLSNCSHPFPWPHLHPDTVFLSPLSPESSPQALWGFFLAYLFVVTHIPPSPPRALSCLLGGPLFICWDECLLTSDIFFLVDQGLAQYGYFSFICLV